MKKALLLFTTGFYLLAGCGGTQPLKTPTLQDEAARHSEAFTRNMALGRYQHALSEAEGALAVSRILDREDMISVSLNNLGVVQERLGLIEEANLSYGEAALLARRSPENRTLAAVLNNMAGMLAETDPEKADVLAREALQVGSSRSWPGVAAKAVHARSRAALARGELDDAGDLCGQALEMARRAGDTSTEAAVLVTRGRLESLAGRDAEAVASLEAALAIDRQLADPYAIALDYSRLAGVQERSGDQEAARLSRDKSREIFRILGIGERGDKESE